MTNKVLGTLIAIGVVATFLGFMGLVITSPPYNGPIPDHDTRVAAVSVCAYVLLGGLATVILSGLMLGTRTR